MRQHPFGGRSALTLSALLLSVIVAIATAAIAAAVGGSRPNLSPLVVPAAASNGAACTKLMNLLPDTVISSATVVSAKADVPEYCKVIGGIEQVILFELDLPTSTWNGKFFYAGGGGYNGTIPTLAHAVVRGYAAAGSDTGHRGEHWDASALYDSPKTQINYAHRGAHLVTVMGKEVVKAFYGTTERHSYFMGCSNGGKMGLMAVQRYPEDFDGVVAGGYVADRTKLMMMFDWTQRALLGAEIPPHKIPAMEQATLAACDARDGLKDGLIDRPDLCAFDPKVLTCQGADAPDCLTPRQVAAWRKILEGPKNSAGQQLYPGYAPGHEGDYPDYITGFGSMHGYPSSNFMYMDSFMRWVVFGPKYDSVRQFDYDKDPAALVKYEKDHDAVQADLSAFRKNRGKLILYNSWSDHSTPPARATQIFEDMRKANGAGADDFIRLFMPPGMYHCGRGPGPNAFGARGQEIVKMGDPEYDIMAALDRWVEKGTAPTKIIATKFKDDDPKRGVARTRPVCAYPQMARYTGSGSIDDAANFVCGNPQ
jgi:tannase/feruloyl esterase